MRVSTSKPTATKRISKKRGDAESALLATCPTTGGGWCSYPFSAKQLEKRMKAKAKLSQIEDLQQNTVKSKSKKATTNSR